MVDVNQIPRDKFPEFLDVYYQEAVIEHPDGNIGWLKDNGPDPLYWHYVCMNWNYGHGMDEIGWIVEQDECAATTAIGLLFAHSSTCLEYTSRDECSDFEKDGYDLAADIARRFREGKYVLGLIKSDPRLLPAATRYSEACNAMVDSSLWDIPNHVLPPLEGEHEFASNTMIKPRSGGGVVFDEGTMMMGMQEWLDANPGRFSWN